MDERLLLDTDVLIDYLRERPEAVTYLEGLTDALFISVITVAELYAGVRGGAEREKLDAFLSAFEIMPVDQEIAFKGGLYRRDYGKSHNTGLADALIAATAEHAPGDVSHTESKTLPDAHEPCGPLSEGVVPNKSLQPTADSVRFAPAPGSG